MTPGRVFVEHPLLLSDAPGDVLAAWHEDALRHAHVESWREDAGGLLAVTRDVAALRAALPRQRIATP